MGQAGRLRCLDGEGRTRHVPAVAGGQPADVRAAHPRGMAALRRARGARQDDGGGTRPSYGPTRRESYRTGAADPGAKRTNLVLGELRRGDSRRILYSFFPATQGMRGNSQAIIV